MTSPRRSFFGFSVLIESGQPDLLRTIPSPAAHDNPARRPPRQLISPEESVCRFALAGTATTLASLGHCCYHCVAMLNSIWLALLASAALLGGFAGRLPETTQGAIDGAENAVKLALGLIGIMALWLGLMRLAERAGLILAVARFLRPLLRRLFPEVPADHPALGSIVMNLAANMLGLNNAATPLGLRAMRDLETLNPHPGVATNAMCTFLAINTSSVQLVPMTAVAVLAANGSSRPSAIIGTAFLATLCSTAAGILAVKSFERLRIFAAPASAGPQTPSPAGAEPQTAPYVPPPPRPLPGWGWIPLGLLLAAFLWFFLGAVGAPSPQADPLHIRAVNALSLIAIPFLLLFFPLYAALTGVRVYEEFVEGAKEGFQVAVRIIPYLVAMLVAVGMFRAAGGVERLSQALRPILESVGFPVELLPLALVRPLSGSGSIALFSDLVKTHGADSLLGRIGGTLLGSTETTFYVIAVYFGSVGVRRVRHSLPAGLIADLVGIAASVWICRAVFGGSP